MILAVCCAPGSSAAPSFPSAVRSCAVDVSRKGPVPISGVTGDGHSKSITPAPSQDRLSRTAPRECPQHLICIYSAGKGCSNGTSFEDGAECLMRVRDFLAGFQRLTDRLPRRRASMLSSRRCKCRSVPLTDGGKRERRTRHDGVDRKTG